MTEDECEHLSRLAQDLAYFAIAYDGLHHELDCNARHDELSEEIGKELVTFTQQRIGRKRDEIEACLDEQDALPSRYEPSRPVRETQP